MAHKVIRDYLQLHVDNTDTIPHFQASVRQSHSVQTQLAMITRDINAALGKENPALLYELHRHKTSLDTQYNIIIFTNKEKLRL